MVENSEKLSRLGRCIGDLDIRVYWEKGGAFIEGGRMLSEGSGPPAYVIAKFLRLRVPRDLRTGSLTVFATW